MTSSQESSDTQSVLRIIDANANRVREGLRVIEEYYRFALDDEDTTRRVKSLRHRVTEAVATLGDQKSLLESRDSQDDVGARSSAESEQTRTSVQAVVAAAFKRVEEGLRVLEEYTKLLPGDEAAARFKTLRFDVYTIEKELRLREKEQ